MSDESRDNSLFYCRVCGFYHGYSTWGENGQHPDYTICECCGCESGLDDETIETVRHYRAKWIAGGAVWFSLPRIVPLLGVKRKTQPDGWSLEEQLKQIPPEWQ